MGDYISRTGIVWRPMGKKGRILSFRLPRYTLGSI